MRMSARFSRFAVFGSRANGSGRYAPEGNDMTFNHGGAQ